jgi:hypothetical protein
VLTARCIDSHGAHDGLRNGDADALFALIDRDRPVGFVENDALQPFLVERGTLVPGV